MARDDVQGSISLRLMCESDFDQLTAWLAQPHVVEWWGEPLTRDAVAAKYGPRVRGQTHVTMFVIEFDGRSVGLAQTYATKDEPAFHATVGIDGAAGFDLFIGDPEALGRGVGQHAIREFCATTVFTVLSERHAVVACPRIDNARSIRAFEHAGFQAIRTVELDEPRPCVVMLFSLARSMQTT